MSSLLFNFRCLFLVVPLPFLPRPFPVPDSRPLAAGPSGIVGFAIGDTPMAARAFDPVTKESFEVAAGGVVSVWLNLHDYRFVVIE